jgi:AraC-like DNA-binding protein
MTEIHLPRGDNNFGFRFISLNYQNPIDNKYFYRMLGKDENWRVAEGNHVNFSDIKPGKYTFEICLSESVPSDDNTTSSIDIIVEPRLYQNRFFVVFLVVFLSGIFFFGLYFIKRLNRRLAKLKESQFSKISRPKYETSYLSRERRNEIEEALLKYISESKVYENPALKISDLATALDFSPHHISQVINQNLNQSFYEFINNYRIESVKFYMEDPSSQKYTLYAIAQKCGYKSKTSFYRAFKKITGYTPTEYQAMLNEKN